LQRAVAAPDLAAARASLLLAGFATPDPSDYAGLAASARGALTSFEEL
jgi:hypothetical protein